MSSEVLVVSSIIMELQVSSAGRQTLQNSSLYKLIAICTASPSHVLLNASVQDAASSCPSCHDTQADRDARCLHKSLLWTVCQEWQGTYRAENTQKLVGGQPIRNRWRNTEQHTQGWRASAKRKGAVFKWPRCIMG
jgi:predicted RNA-binding Zn-ribbon protein involved in translation (DUF1610 family)